ncbi:MAG: hypothetical protein AB7E66_05815 [Parvibaculaceae bacterium]
MSYIQLALAVGKLLLWITKQVDQAQWKAAGRNEQLAADLKAIADAAGIARQIEAETKKMTDAEIDADLDAHGEFRP